MSSQIKIYPILDIICPIFGYIRRRDIKPKLKTYKGGNDYEIFESERTIGHTVTSWKDTMEQCTKLFLN